MIRKVYMCLALSLLTIGSLFAQNVLSSQDMVSIIPMVSDQIELPSHAQKILAQKMTQVVTQNGFGATGGGLVLTANIVVTDVQITGTVPPMTLVDAEVSLVLVDLGEKVVLEEMPITVRGIDKTQDRALIKCVNMINPRNVDVRSFMNRCRSKVIDYYTTRIPALIAKANSLASRSEFDEAISVLSVIPESVDEYPAVADVMVEIYTQKIDFEAKPLILEAKSLLAGGHYDAAMEALINVDPNSSQYSVAESMIQSVKEQLDAEKRARIEARMAAREQRRQDALLAQEQSQRNVDNAIMVEMEKIKAAKEVGLAAAANGSTMSQISNATKSMASDLNDWFMGYFR